jgi:hypothetical protein
MLPTGPSVDGAVFSLAQARDESACADSYRRVDVVLSGFMRLARLDAFALLGSEWPCCDNRWMWRGYLRQELRGASREELDPMMEPEELAALALMPERFTVYRPILRTGAVTRSRAVLKLDRKEREIIAHAVHGLWQLIQRRGTK